MLQQVMGLGCIYTTPGLCVTTVEWKNQTHISNLTRQLGIYLTSNWSYTLDNLTTQLGLEIIKLNSTRVHIEPISAIFKSLKSIFSFTKAWAGIMALGILIVLGLGLMIRCLMHVRRQQ